jgi:hypothetical protein
MAAKPFVANSNKVVNNHFVAINYSGGMMLL